MYSLRRLIFVSLSNYEHLSCRHKTTYSKFICVSPLSLLLDQYKPNGFVERKNFRCQERFLRMSTQRSSLFEGQIDRFSGVTVDSHTEHCSVSDLPQRLSESIDKWKEENRRGIWFKVHLSDSEWVPILAKAGFQFHHAKDDYVMMYIWLGEETCNIPPYSHTMIGVGAVVVNDKSQILVVSEKHYNYPHWKLPGGYVEPGENLVDAAIREVYEETNISTEFLSLLTFRHSHYRMFDCSDIYFVIGLKPTSYQIEKCNREIAESKWMDVQEYLNHPHVHELNKFCLQKYLEHVENNIKIDCYHGIHQVLKLPYVAYYVSRIDKDEPRGPDK